MPSALPQDFDLDAIERHFCVEALELAGNIVDAAHRLGITRQAMKRRIKKHRIAWPRPARVGPRVATTADVFAVPAA
ncbi:helix-turn-helix domain-containing protein [Nannocystis pusilla]|uniref:Helix-turn-helix domain-containing protein n=1 Tax=Nannocystis pusilla TaxID=889268 RepID=A0ABS7TL66_9BACT|nr:helix-turn-helix domain-containing protein [Nannocystis pusilla]MBZ5708939.1 helix-turn-helix domain-containing protein [Nannocystis pusilla]